jgi:hypothetical protein
MRKLTLHRFSFLGLFLILTLLTPSILAQIVKDEWGPVREIKEGSKLVVKTKTGQKHQGNLKSITDDSLTLSDPKSSGQDVILRRDEIAEIRKKSFGHIATMAALIGGLGLGGGYGIGYGIGEAKNSQFEPEYPTAAFGAGVGAVIGAIIGSRGQVVYKVP